MVEGDAVVLFLMPVRDGGGRRTPGVAEAEAKRELAQIGRK